MKLTSRSPILTGLLVFGSYLGCIAGQNALAHGDEARVAIELESAAQASAGDNQINFQLVDLKQKRVLTDSDLAIEHENKLHFYVFDAALMEFRHAHATFVRGLWSATVALPRSGTYWVWAQGQISAGQEEFAGSTQITVTSGTPANTLPPVLGDNRIGSSGLSVLTLTSDTFHATQDAMPTLSFTRSDGSAPQITPYLGELAHVVVVSSDGDSLIHVHPMSVKGNEMMLHLVFPGAGEYRLWVQFIDGGELKVVPLAVRVL